MTGFAVWSLCGALFIGMGIYALRRHKPVGFWANSKAPRDKIADVPAFNRAVGRLWMIFGTLFIVLGLPLLAGQNSPFILISVLGAVCLTVALMMVYSRILSKYKS